MDVLSALGMYDKKSHILHITRSDGTEEAIVHAELSGGKTYYYYNTQNTKPFTYEMILGNTDDYNRLVNDDHLIDDNDMYRHTNGNKYAVLRRRIGDVREYYINVNVEPSAYDSIAIVEFANLPLYNLNGDAVYYTVRETKEPDGYISLGNFKSLTGLDLYNGGASEVHDFSFLVTNNKKIELPLSGDNRSALMIMFGSMMITLGSIYLFLVLYKKKKGHFPAVLTSFLE